MVRRFALYTRTSVLSLSLFLSFSRSAIVWTHHITSQRALHLLLAPRRRWPLSMAHRARVAVVLNRWVAWELSVRVGGFCEKEGRVRSGGDTARLA